MALLQKILVSHFVGRLQRRIGLGAGKIGLGLGQGSFVLGFFNGEQKLVLLDERTVRHRLLFQKAVNTGNQVHLIDRGDLTDKGNTVADVFRGHFGNGHRLAVARPVPTRLVSRPNRPLSETRRPPEGQENVEEREYAKLSFVKLRRLARRPRRKIELHYRRTT